MYIFENGFFVLFWKRVRAFCLKLHIYEGLKETILHTNNNSK
ncbi:hypothetical protein B4077_5591 [Bacillus cereus]|jgi:hypothetical protein|uniref:Uncharacterized protein n=1 Tax=Bacillus cereus TaxID=1396 RepID=A0A0G8EVR6_BACCE|nr:hypothetical protein B4077_5591 [Bacillus cereus]